MFLFLILIGGITDWSRLEIRGTGILPVSIDHGMGILVELASCQFQ
ncbi:MAG: hypothetical protein F6K53_11570 [Moorea sp. SIO4A1]|nr:hypothetical protein [Moorena sp. SIO4A1]NEQ58009.1 hypothetical protein [Moorena sp. SIO4A1]